MSKAVGGFVYVVGVDWHGPVKIGVAIDVVRRIDRLQSGNHLKLSVLWQSERLTDPFAVETLLHQRFAAWLVRGEWFHIDGLSVETIAGAVADVAGEVRDQRVVDKETLACSQAVVAMIDRLRRVEGMSTEDALGQIAVDTGLGRSTIWSLRYRPPFAVTVGVYAAVAALVYRLAGRAPFETYDIPPELVLRLVTEHIKLPLGDAESRTGTEG